MTDGLITAGSHTIVPDDIDCHCQLEIGHFCSIAAGLTIVSGQHPGVGFPECISNFPFKEHGWGDWYPPSKHDGYVKIGSDVWIGQNVTIMDGVIVGHGAILAAGAVVVKDVPHYALVAGNPAEVKKFRFGSAQIEVLLKSAWWDWSDEKISSYLSQMTDVALFTGK